MTYSCVPCDDAYRGRVGGGGLFLLIRGGVFNLSVPCQILICARLETEDVIGFVHKSLKSTSLYAHDNDNGLGIVIDIRGRLSSATLLLVLIQDEGGDGRIVSTGLDHLGFETGGLLFLYKYLPNLHSLFEHILRGVCNFKEYCHY